MNDNIRLTQYSHGAGCGCKISPKVLETILKTNQLGLNDPRVLVGNENCDDAAVFDLENGTALISTTDFFMPIVDDPFLYGRISAVNAISDVYAMGGEPLLAIAILGWPIGKIDTAIAGMVLDGGRFACREAGISLSGGHSIDSPEPIFGLAVTGQVNVGSIKRNNTAKAGCKLYLTKPLGVGILTTAQKQGKLKPGHFSIAPDSMTRLNSVGKELGKMNGVLAMTDVTGFGLLGHLAEMCRGSNLSALIEADLVPRFTEVDEYLAQNCIPGGTHRNWDSYGHLVHLADDNSRLLLCDPQTSGGLLIAVEERSAPSVETLLRNENLESTPIGVLTEKKDYLIEVL